MKAKRLQSSEPNYFPSRTGSSQIQSHTLTAERFNEVWKRGTYDGFSRGTPGESKTPFLDAFVDQIKGLQKETPRVAELGAGSFDHSVHLAEEGFVVTANEYSQAAVALARERLAKLPALEAKIQIVPGDLFDYAKRLIAGSLDGVYANSVLHFLSAEERRRLYELLHTAHSDGGLLAISFKALGDALQSRGKLVQQTGAGPIIEGADRISRLFVSDTEPLAKEMEESGYRVRQVIRWSVPNYNIDGENGEFVGLLAIRNKNK